MVNIWLARLRKAFSTGPGLQTLAQPDRSQHEMLGALFVMYRPITQLQRCAAVGFRRPVEAPRCPPMPLSPDRDPPHSTVAVSDRPHTTVSVFRADDLTA